MSRRPTFTKEALVAALQAADGDSEKAARLLSVHYTTVNRAKKRWGVEVQEERRVIAA